MSFWKNLAKGDVKGALNNLIDAVIGHLPTPLGSLVSRLMSDEGQVAYHVALDAWNHWTDESMPLPDVVSSAVAQALSEGVSVAEKDVADWLGLIDRNAA